MAWVYNLHGDDPGNETVLIIVICVVFPSLAVAAVLLRLYVRRFTNRPLWVDDYAALSSAIFTVARAGLVIYREFLFSTSDIQQYG
jgi:hypothetical protein